MATSQRPRGFSGWVVRHLPEKVAVNPERTLINVGCLLIGLSTLVAGRQDVLARLWPLAQYEWGGAMLVGGGAALLGMLGQQRTPERLGLLLILASSLFYAVFLVGEFGFRGLITAVIFFFIAVAKGIRLSVGAVARQRNIHVGEQMLSDEQDHGAP